MTHTIPLVKKETMIMDPVHGFINISEYPVIEELVESKYFQRLRRLAQLGPTSAVYPNATHSRFVHSLGVMHVFLVLYDAITRKEESFPGLAEKRRIGAIAALLHDVGHGPFSHASEAILDRNFGGFDHEEMTCSIITDTEVRGILERHDIDPRSVCDLINHTDSREWRMVSQLISSQLDADRLDYLVRDSHFTGVNYGKIDLYRIVNTMEVWHGQPDDPFNGTAIISNKGITAIENYILGRHLMYEGVYFHKLSRCMDLLLQKIFKRAAELDDEQTHLSKVIDINTKTTPELLYSMDDYSCTGLFHEWTGSKDPILQDLALRILERRRLATVSITTEQYTRLGVRLDRLPRMVEEAGFSDAYYYIEDSYAKSAYDTYDPEELEEGGFSAIGHIMTPDGDRLQEISGQSKVISTLSQLKNKRIRIFVPEEALQGVRRIVGN